MRPQNHAENTSPCNRCYNATKDTGPTDRLSNPCPSQLALHPMIVVFMEHRYLGEIS